MTKNEQDGTIWCHQCAKWVRADIQTLRIYGEQKDSIICINCEAHLGYDTDWPEKFGDVDIESHPADYHKKFDLGE